MKLVLGEEQTSLVDMELVPDWTTNKVAMITSVGGLQPGIHLLTKKACLSRSIFVERFQRNIKEIITFISAVGTATEES